jgi:ParB-like chromosome segregation protein Spo0J
VYSNNPRINDDALDVVAASLKEYGFRQPIVVDAEEGRCYNVSRAFAG